MDSKKINSIDLSCFPFASWNFQHVGRNIFTMKTNYKVKGVVLTSVLARDPHHIHQTVNVISSLTLSLLVFIFLTYWKG